MASLQHSFCPLLSLEHNILLYESFTLSIYIQMKSWKRAVSVYVVSDLSDISLTSWTNTAWTYWHHEQILRAHIWASNIALHVSFLMNLHHWDVIAPSPLSSASWACRSAVSNCRATLWWSTKRQASSLPSLSPCAKNYGHLSKWKQQIWGYRLQAHDAALLFYTVYGHVREASLFLSDPLSPCAKNYGHLSKRKQQICLLNQETTNVWWTITKPSTVFVLFFPFIKIPTSCWFYNLKIRIHTSSLGFLSNKNS